MAQSIFNGHTLDRNDPRITKIFYQYAKDFCKRSVWPGKVAYSSGRESRSRKVEDLRFNLGGTKNKTLFVGNRKKLMMRWKGTWGQ